MDCQEVKFSGHAIRRMFERSITRDEALSAVEVGELIAEYPDDEPFPSFLLLARVRERILHLLWEPDFRTRRRTS
jgi:hypothetical protein